MNEKSIDLADINRNMIVHIMKENNNIQNKLKWLENEIKLIKELILAMNNESK